MQNKVSVVFFLIIFLSGLFWRFINYDNRWTLSQDQARDAIIALHSIHLKSLPLIGPPSSASYFSFGPFYYWLIIFFSLIFPFNFYNPWIGFTLLSFISVLIFFLIGKSLGGKSLAFILGGVASFSSAAVFHSVDMLNPMLVPFFTIFTFFSLIKLIDQQKIKYALALGLWVGLAINFHFQALGLLSILLISPFLNNFSFKRRLLLFLWVNLGFIITFLPLILFNLQNNWIHFKNIFVYLLTGHTKFAQSTYLIKDLILFWPKLWGEVLTFIPQWGYFFFPVVSVTIILSIRNRVTFPKSVWIILLSLLIQMITLPLYKGARLPVYLLVFHPFIILLTAFSFWMIWKKQNVLGIGLMAVFLLMSTLSNFKIIQGYTQKPLILQLKKALDSQSKNIVSLYSNEHSNMVSLPLFYLYFKENKLSQQGYKIGACEQWCPQNTVPFLKKENYSLYDLNNLSEDQLKSLDFKRLTSEQIYDWLYDYYR